MKKILIIFSILVMCMSSTFAYASKEYTFNETKYKYNDELSNASTIVFSNFIGESVAVMVADNTMKLNMGTIKDYGIKMANKQVNSFKQSGITAETTETEVKKLSTYSTFVIKMDIVSKKAYQATCIIPENGKIYQVVISTTKESKISDREIEKVLHMLVLPGHEDAHASKDLSGLTTILIIVVVLILIIGIAIAVMFKMTGHTVFR